MSATPSAERSEAGLASRPPEPIESAGRSTRWATGWARVLVVAAGIGLTLLTVRDGSPLWQGVRALVVVGLTVLVWWTVGHATRAARGATCFASGLLATAIGAGFALPHLAKGGPVLVQVAGTVVLLAGVALAVGGAVTLVRSARGWARPPVVVALLLVTFVVLLSLTQAIGATNVPATHLDETTPADFDLAYRDVTFSTPDGVTLSGWYLPSTNGAAILVAHGAGSTRSAALPHGVALARAGYGVLLFDARGHGQSEGRAMDFGWYGDEDVAGALDFLRRQPDVDPARLGAFGLSMGGEEVVGAAASSPELRAMAAEGATNRVPADKAWLSDEYGWRGWIQEQIEWLVYGSADLLTEARPPRSLRSSAVASAPRPVLLIAAGDRPDESLAAEYIQSGSPDTVEVWVAPDTGHTDAIRVHPEEWEERVVSFFDQALRPT